MEWSHWFAGFCTGGGLALAWASYQQHKDHWAWMDLTDRLEVLVYHYRDRCEELEELSDEGEAWKYN